MSVPKKPKDVLLVLSILGSRWDQFWPRVQEDLKEALGEIEYISPMILFTETTYYDRELGTPIYRRILSFKDLIPPDKLAEIKLTTNEIEKKYAR